MIMRAVSIHAGVETDQYILPLTPIIHNYSLEHNLTSQLMQDLVDVDVFLDAKRVIDSLQNKEIAPALAWCAENRSRLKKSKVCFTVLFRNSYYIDWFASIKNSAY